MSKSKQELREESYVKGALGLQSLGHSIRQWAVEKGFEADVEDIRTCIFEYDGFPPSESDRLDTALDRLFDLAQVGLIVSELGELVEAIRKPRQDDHVAEMDNGTVEIADTIIRLLHLNQRRSYRGDATASLDEAIPAKMLENEGRPYKHGKQA